MNISILKSKINNHKTIIFLLILTIYGPTLRNQFISDDIFSLSSPTIGTLEPIRDHPFFFVGELPYFISYNLAGSTPWIFRIWNILAHIGTSMLIYNLVKKLHNPQTAIIASLLFAVHPLATESVTWISGHSSSHYTFFALLALYFYIKNTTSSYLLSMVYLTASFSSSMRAISVGLLLPFFDWLYSAPSKSNSSIFNFGFLHVNYNYAKFSKPLPILLITILFAFSIFHRVDIRANNLVQNNYTHIQFHPLSDIPHAVTEYLYLFIWPKRITLYHTDYSWITNSFLKYPIFVIVSIAALYGLLTKKKYGLYLIWFFIGLIPTLTPWSYAWLVAERYLYFSLAGLCILTAIIFENLLKKIKSPRTLDLLKYSFFVILVLLSSKTFTRNLEWRNQDTLWPVTVNTSPSSPNAHNNMGDYYARHNDLQAAIHEFQTAIQLNPIYADAYHNLAYTQTQSGDIQTAITNYQQAIQHNPHIWQSYLNLAGIFWQIRQSENTIKILSAGIKDNPTNPQLHLALAQTYFVLGQKTNAIKTINQLLKIDPNNPEARLLKAKIK